VTRRRADADASDSEGQAGQDEAAAIRLHLDELLGQRGMTLTELSARVGITIVNLSILKNGRARAIRFSTLARLCEALGCQPGELLSYQPRPSSHADAGPAGQQADGSSAEPAGARPA
jgi:putative transcriptional regulator